MFLIIQLYKNNYTIIYKYNYTIICKYNYKKLYRKCGFYKKIVQRTVSGNKVLGPSEYKTKHNNTVKKDTAGNLVEKHLNTNFSIMIEMCTRKLHAK